MANTHNSATIVFPRPKKRGAKVRLGPCATIIPFPGQLSGDALEGQYEWMARHGSCWETTAIAGVEPVSQIVRSMVDAMRIADGLDALTAANKRESILRGRSRIEKRNQVKAWLTSLGAGEDAMRDPEQALFFAYDQVCGQEPPASA